jgi:hypothetical protein
MILEIRMHRKLVVGSLIPHSRAIDHGMRFSKLKSFIKAHPCPQFERKVDLHKALSDQIGAAASICYFELGVYNGGIIRKWCESNTNTTSVFHGLDTFEGIPMDWDHVFGKTAKGSYSAKGILPDMNDSRVELHKGLFSETLPDILHDLVLGDRQLVIHYDADLYGSTILPLILFDPWVDKLGGYIAIFDEFSSVAHEFRALEDYLLATGRRLEPLGACGEAYDQFAVMIRPALQ